MHIIFRIVYMVVPIIEILKHLNKHVGLFSKDCSVTQTFVVGK